MLKKMILLWVAIAYCFSCAVAAEKMNETEYSSGTEKKSRLKQSYTDENWSQNDLYAVVDKITASILVSKINTPAYKKLPIIVGGIENETDEIIRTRTIGIKIQVALSKEGFRFISNESATEEFIKLSLLQNELKELDENKKLSNFGKSVGAKMFLRGKIKNTRKKDGDKKEINYYLFFELVGFETQKVIWSDSVQIGRIVNKN